MAIRTGLLASITISKNDGSDAFTVDEYDLGSNTTAPPTDNTQSLANGTDRDVGRGFAPVVQILKTDVYEDLDDWQVDGELLRIVYTYDDGHSYTFHKLGFTVMEDRATEFGTVEGCTITSSNRGLSDADVVTVA